MLERVFAAAVLLLGCHAEVAAQLPEPVAKLLRAANIPQDAVGAIVLRGERVLLSHNAERSMQPASTMKLVTSVVALEQLGPIFRGRTELRTSAALVDGVLAGDLLLRGGADPDFNDDVLRHMLQSLRNQGVRTIAGDLIVDRQLFQPSRQDLVTPPFDESAEFRYNVVPDAALLNTSLLHIGFNATGSKLDLVTTPQLEGVSVSADMTLVDASCAAWENGWRAPDYRRLDNGVLQVVLHGTFPKNCTAATNLNVLDRQDYVDRLFRATWRQLGGDFQGAVREAAGLGGNAEAPTRLLAEHVARPLPDVLREMNKNSDNTLARTIYLSLGSLEMDPLNGSRPASFSNADTTAQRAEQQVRAWLRRHHIDERGIVLENGAGLSRSERIAPAQLAAVLQAGSQGLWAPELLSSLPIAGLDGTMWRRLGNSAAASRARIKTGSLRNAVAVAGYVPDASNQPCIVVAMINLDTLGKGGAGRAALDALIDWVATSAPLADINPVHRE